MCPLRIDPGYYEEMEIRLTDLDRNSIVGDFCDKNGNILPNDNFPDMKSMTEYIHAKGLRAGIYTSPGSITCQRYAGSYMHEQQDAEQYAAWGFDFLKYDWCSYQNTLPFFRGNLNDTVSSTGTIYRCCSSFEMSD